MRYSAKPLVSSVSFRFVGIPTMQDCLKVGCCSINPDLHPSGTPPLTFLDGKEEGHQSNQIETQLNTSITEILHMTSQDISVSVRRNKAPAQYTEPSHVLLLLLFSTFASFPYLRESFALHKLNRVP